MIKSSSTVHICSSVSRSGVYAPASAWTHAQAKTLYTSYILFHLFYRALMIFLMILLQGTLMMIVTTVMVVILMTVQYIGMTLIKCIMEDIEEIMDIHVVVMLEETIGVVTVHLSLI